MVFGGLFNSDSDSQSETSTIDDRTAVTGEGAINTKTGAATVRGGDKNSSLVSTVTTNVTDLGAIQASIDAITKAQGNAAAVAARAAEANARAAEASVKSVTDFSASALASQAQLAGVSIGSVLDAVQDINDDLLGFLSLREDVQAESRASELDNTGQILRDSLQKVFESTRSESEATLSKLIQTVGLVAGAFVVVMFIRAR